MELNMRKLGKNAKKEKNEMVILAKHTLKQDYITTVNSVGENVLFVDSWWVLLRLNNKKLINEKPTNIFCIFSQYCRNIENDSYLSQTSRLEVLKFSYCAIPSHNVTLLQPTHI